MLARALDNPIYDGSTSVGVTNLDASQEVNDTSDERNFENPLYSETDPPCYKNTTSKPVAESEYEGLYSDCTMNGEALYENTQSNVVRGILKKTNGNTLHVTASGDMYGNMPPTLDSVDEDTCTIYCVLGLSELNQPKQFLNQTGFEHEYSCLHHK